MQKVTIQNNLDLRYVVQNYWFQFEIVIEGKWTIEILFFFSVEKKKKNQLKRIKILRSFLLI